MKNSNLLFLLLVFIISTPNLLAQDSTQTDRSNEKAEVAVTRHSVQIGDEVINYTATAGTMELRDENNKPIALHGFVAYTKDGVEDPSTRPITFAYNGGPGSSSIWLHMGALGPKRVVVTDPGNTPPSPYTLIDNEYSILDVTDIIMMDPIGTGLSHAIGEAKNTDFWGVDQDIEAISNFVHQYVTENDRWSSPKYLLGESYGTMRNAGVVAYLQNNLAMTMNGVIMISAVFDLRTLTFSVGDDISYIVNLPTYAATAWYHDRVPDKPANVESFLDDARAFAAGAYAQALMKGDRLGGDEYENVISKMAYFTGLSEEYLAKAKLRVTQGEFSQELLRDQRLTVGRLDSRFTGFNQDLLSQSMQYDPQSAAISPAYKATFMDYFYNTLEVNKEKYYHVSAYAREGFKWDWRHSKSASSFFPIVVNTGVDMAEALSQNPYLKILVFNGYYDLATPFYGVEYSIHHLELETEVKFNIEMAYFEAGHMMYTHEPSLIKFKQEIADFINQ